MTAPPPGARRAPYRTLVLAGEMGIGNDRGERVYRAALRAARNKLAAAERALETVSDEEGCGNIFAELKLAIWRGN